MRVFKIDLSIEYTEKRLKAKRLDLGQFIVTAIFTKYLSATKPLIHLI